MIRCRIFLISILILLSCEKNKLQREVSYHTNGTLKYEVMLINGKWEGVKKDYFPNGKIRGEFFYKEGKRDGKSVIYYENKNLRQESVYKAGICVTSKDYTEDGFLEELRIYDSLGRIFDYYRYKKDNTRNFAREMKDPIFIPEGDTLILGKTYSTEIRLGNRQYDNIEVFIGDIEDADIAKKNLPLPKKDSLTSIINIKADSLGWRRISGIVIERSATSDSLDVIPFTHRFYVKPR